MTTPTTQRPQRPQHGTRQTSAIATESLPAPEIRFARRMRLADSLETLVWLSVALVLALYLADGGAIDFTSVGGFFRGIGIVAGLIGSDLMLIQLVLAARLPIIDRTFGHDRALAAHQKLGKPVLYLIVAHMVMLLIGYGMADGSNPFAEAWTMITSVPDMLLAFVGMALLLAVVVTSLVIVRRRFSYEAWYVVHLLAYASVLAALPHQFSSGQLFAEGTWARWYWIALYVFAIGSILVYRFGVPIVRSMRHALVVSKVDVIAPGVISIELTGKHLDSMPVRSGQFFVWRFWAAGLWWHSHPFSLSSAPDGTHLRITVRDLGDGSRALSKLRVGTRVSIEGPYGLFTELARSRRRIVLIGSGIGITPIRSLLEQASFKPGEATVILRAANPEQVYLWQEVYDLCVARGASLQVMHGSRPTGVDTWLNADTHAKGATLSKLAPRLAESDIYVCGPRDWSDLVVRDAKASGVPAGQIHYERFDW